MRSGFSGEETYLFPREIRNSPELYPSDVYAKEKPKTQSRARGTSQSKEGKKLCSSPPSGAVPRSQATG